MLQRLNLSAFVLVACCTSCGSGGGLVSPNSPLNPTTAPSGAGVTPTPTATPVGATPTPTAVGATPTPTPTATSGTLGGCVHSNAAPSSQDYSVGNGTQANQQPAETLQLPNYPSTGTPIIVSQADLPSTWTSSGAGTTLTIKVSQNNFDNVSQLSYGSRTPDLFSSVEVSPNALGVGNGSNQILIPVTITSACIVPGTTYTVNEVALSASLYSETDTPTSTTVTGHIKAAINPFTANEIVDFIVSH